MTFCPCFLLYSHMYFEKATFAAFRLRVNAMEWMANLSVT